MAGSWILSRVYPENSPAHFRQIIPKNDSTAWPKSFTEWMTSFYKIAENIRPDL